MDGYRLLMFKEKLIEYRLRQKVPDTSYIAEKSLVTILFPKKILPNYWYKRTYLVNGAFA